MVATTEGGHTLNGESKSNASSTTNVHAPVMGGEGESAIPVNKEEEAVENIVDDWDTDPVNARNWSGGKKWLMVLLISLYTLVPPLGSSMMAPGLSEIAIEYGITDPTVIALTLSIFLVSFAIGPLFLAPLSEMYGRTWILHIGNLLSIAFSLGCAFAPNTAALLVFRFFVGFSGSAPVACGGGSIGDMFSERDRASAMALYSLGPLLGPAIGPVAGGFITQEIGVKWVFIVIAILSGACSALGIPLLKETYAPVIRARRDKKLIKSGGDVEAAAAKAKYHPVTQNTNTWAYLWTNLQRPFILLFGSLICFMLSLYMAFIYGIYYLMFTTFEELFHGTYGFSTGIGGLAYLGLGVGFFAATIFGAKFSDQVYKHLSSKNGGVGKPEMRIPALIFGSFFVPIGLFWYGWSAEAEIHWMMPIVGSGIFGFGVMTTFLPIQLYLVDTFKYAASALAAASVFRSMLGFAFPLFGHQMYTALGTGGGNSMLAGLAIVLGIPFPIWIYFKGEEMRMKSKLSR